MVELTGIEPVIRQCHCRVIPLHYSPVIFYKKQDVDIPEYISIILHAKPFSSILKFFIPARALYIGLNRFSAPCFPVSIFAVKTS